MLWADSPRSSKTLTSSDPGRCPRSPVSLLPGRQAQISEPPVRMPLLGRMPRLPRHWSRDCIRPRAVGRRFKGYFLPPPHESLRVGAKCNSRSWLIVGAWIPPIPSWPEVTGSPRRRSSTSSSDGVKRREIAGAVSDIALTILAGGDLAWSCLFDTHNDLRLAVNALSGGFLNTIYAKFWESVRLGYDFLETYVGPKMRDAPRAIV